MSTSVSRLFAKLRTGDQSALSGLTPALYDELHPGCSFPRDAAGLVDYARARASQKRSSGAGRDVPWTTNLEVISDRGTEPLELVELDYQRPCC